MLIFWGAVPHAVTKNRTIIKHQKSAHRRSWILTITTIHFFFLITCPWNWWGRIQFNSNQRSGLQTKIWNWAKTRHRAGSKTYWRKTVRQSPDLTRTTSWPFTKTNHQLPSSSITMLIERFSRAGGRGREWATLGVHPLSWLLSNNRLEEVCGTLTTGTFSSRLLLSNQDKGCTPSVAHSLPLPLGPALLNLWIVINAMHITILILYWLSRSGRVTEFADPNTQQLNMVVAMRVYSISAGRTLH